VTPRLGRASQLPAARGGLIERHAGGTERVTEVALPVERLCDGRPIDVRGAAVTARLVSDTRGPLYERDQLVEVSLQSGAPRSRPDRQKPTSTAGDQRINERVGEPRPHGFGSKLRRAFAELRAGAWVGAG
jgi:hypothetical protein